MRETTKRILPWIIVSVLMALLVVGIVAVPYFADCALEKWECELNKRFYDKDRLEICEK